MTEETSSGWGELEIEWKSMSDLDVDVKVTSFIPIPSFLLCLRCVRPKTIQVPVLLGVMFSFILFYIIR